MTSDQKESGVPQKAPEPDGHVSGDDCGADASCCGLHQQRWRFMKAYRWAVYR